MVEVSISSQPQATKADSSLALSRPSLYGIRVLAEVADSFQRSRLSASSNRCCKPDVSGGSLDETGQSAVSQFSLIGNDVTGALYDGQKI
jgi:hypothetical protein